MSYTPNTWATGNVVTATKLNNLESGVSTNDTNISALATKADSIDANMASLFSSATAYSAGDYVIYNDQLYRFTADHAIGAWTGSDATAVSLTGETVALRSDLSDLESDNDSLSDIESSAQHFAWENGEISSGQDSGSSSKRIRTKGFYKIHDGEILTSESNWYYYIIYYDASKTFTVSKGWHTGSQKLDNQYAYYRVMGRNVNSGLDVNPTNGANYSAEYKTDLVKSVSVLYDGETPMNFVWEVGQIANGADQSSAKRIRTIGKYNTANAKIMVDEGWYVAVAYYNADGSFAESEYWISGEYYINQSHPYFRVMMRNEDSNMDMVTSYASHLSATNYSIYEKYIDDNGTAPKSYLLSTLESAISKANADYDEPKLMFVWVTDSHLNPKVQSNAKVWQNTVNAIRYISNHVPSRFILHTGDYVDLNYYTANGASNAEVFEAISKSIRDLHDVDNRLLIANGNHDGVGANGYGNVQWYYSANGSINNGYAVKNGVPNAYSYKDFEDLKVRVITMSLPDSNNENTYYWGFSKPQIDWLKDVALQTDDGYSVIITVHTPMYATNNGTVMGNVDVVYGIINAYHSHTTYSGSYSDYGQTVTVNVDFSNKTNTKVIACFAGHTHGDTVVGAGETKNGQVNGLPCPVIVSGAAWFDATGETGYTAPSRAYHDATEILFNVVCYYPDEQKIDVIRVGAGSDMSIDLS